jgi:hypothetical protein
VNARGTALVETAFVMGIVLMIVFGGIQLSVLAFTQASQDGAAFTAAHAYAANPGAGVAGATAAAHGIFSHVPASAITVTPAGTGVSATVTGSAQGLPVPGTPSTFTLNAVAAEPLGSATPAPGATQYPFAVTATLSNYYTPAGASKPSYSIGLAQTFVSRNCDATGGNQGCDGNHQYSGNGTTLRFAEWTCRGGLYSQIAPPSTGSTSNAWFDPTNSGSALHAIYLWDAAGGTCQ